MIAQLKDWLHSWVPEPLAKNQATIEMPQGLQPLDLSAGDPRKLNLASAKEFVSLLRPDGLAGLEFEALGQPPRSMQRTLKAGLMQWSEKGLVLVMKKENNKFDLTFAEVWSKLKSFGVKEAKKMLVDNHVLWTWKWETDGAVCNLSFWSYLDNKNEQGLRFSCVPRPF